MKKVTIVILIALLTLMVFIGCSKEDTSIIKIGGIFPLSGEVAVYGIEAKNGIELAIAEINAKGGVNGKQIVLISEDDEGSPEKSVNAFKKLTSKNKVQVIIGSLTSGCTAAITTLAQNQKVLLIAPAATMESITDAGNYVFRACFIDPFQGTVGGKFAAETLGSTRAAVLYDTDNDYSVGLYENFKVSFVANGGVMVSEESYTTSDVDFNAQITKIKASNPDVVYLPDYYAKVSLIAKQLRGQNINTPIVGADGWGGITDNAGDEILNGFYSDHYAADSTDNIVVSFVNAYKEKYKSTPVSFAALGYDSMYIIKDAMLRAGSEDAVSVRNEVEKTNGAYVTGQLRFDAKRNPIKSAVMMEIVKQNGALTPVFKATVNP